MELMRIKSDNITKQGHELINRQPTETKHNEPEN